MSDFQERSIQGPLGDVDCITEPTDLDIDTPLVVNDVQGLSTDSTTTLTDCWKCGGSGMKRQKARSSKESRRKLVLVPCGACQSCGRRSMGADGANEKRKRSPLRPFRPLYAWDVPGRPAAFAMDDPSVSPSEGEMLCALSGHWCMFQLADGHRLTTDDVMTAAVAVQTVQKDGLSPKRYLDIGTGLASVLLMVHWKLGPSLLATVGIEAQSKHLELASRSLAFNGCREECQLVHGDLRNLDDGLTGNLGTFDLITGTPPYFPSRVGVLPIVSARGMCSFELRGGIEVYFQAAAKLLAPGRDSRFVVCQTSLEIPRTERAAHDSGMTILERVDVHGKKGKHGPLFSVFVCCWSQEQDIVDRPAVRYVYARLGDNSYSDEMIQVMELLGKPIPRDHPRQPQGSLSQEKDPASA